MLTAACVNWLLTPIQAYHLLVALKPYWRTRPMIERTHKDYGGACVLKTVARPCFNATSAYRKDALGEANWLATQLQGAGCPRYNIYNWAAFWVQETIDKARGVTLWPMALPEREPARRLTDIPLLRPQRGWTKQFVDLDDSIAHQLSSQQKTPND